LSNPDWLEFSWTGTSIGLLTDDGSPTTGQLAQALTAEGLKVIVLSFPLDIVPQRSPLPEGILRVELADLSETHLQQTLGDIMATYGSICTFIHLHPRLPLSPDRTLSYPAADKAILRQVFLMAKHLKQTLTAAAHGDRSGFLTITALDGAFGLSPRRHSQTFSAMTGGLFGLTKTLGHEWPNVFCRGIDFSPELKPDQVVQAILAELHDPNAAIVEVGYGSDGRTTLNC
jgi:hypothetical protein